MDSYFKPNVYKKQKEGFKAKITSKFGSRIDPVTKESTQFHGGIDLDLQDSNLSSYPKGSKTQYDWNAELISLGKGKIEVASFDRVYGGGNTVKIRHENDKGEIYYTGYAHLNEIYVKVGDSIEKEQVIGVAGNTGGHTTGPHLHFSMRDSKNQKIDPEKFDYSWFDTLEKKEEEKYVEKDSEKEKLKKDLEYIELKPSSSVSGFKFLSIKKFIMSAGLNNHNKAAIVGNVSKQDFEEYKKSEYYKKEIKISVFGKDESGKDFEEELFNGIIKNITFSKRIIYKEGGEIYQIKINIISYSYLMDINLERVIYQNKQTTYMDIFNSIEKKYSGTAVISMNKDKISGYHLQYGETDWKFMNRIASSIGEPVILQRLNKKIFIDYFEEEDKNVDSKEIDGDSSSIKEIKKIKTYKILDCKRIFDIGEYITITNKVNSDNSESQAIKEKYFVIKSIVKLEGESLKYYYKLLKANAENKLIKKRDNRLLSGKSIMAKVRAVSKIGSNNGGVIDLDFSGTKDEGIKNGDVSTKIEDNYMFSIWHEYGGKTNGSYILPEAGDKVMLYFYGCKEEETLIKCCRREKDNFNKILHKAENKSIAVPTGQGIIVSKDRGVNIYGNSIEKEEESSSIIHISKNGTAILSSTNKSEKVMEKSEVGITIDTSFAESGGIIDINIKNRDSLMDITEIISAKIKNSRVFIGESKIELSSNSKSIEINRDGIYFSKNVTNG